MDLKRLLISIYFGIENLYYNALDQINKVIPIYKYAIDPLEKNKIPSMPIYIGLFLLVILSISALGAAIVINNNTNKVSIEVTVRDSLGFTVSGATIDYSLNDELTSEQTNGRGVAKLTLKKGQTVVFQINADGYLQKTYDFTSKKQNEKINIELIPTTKKEQELSTQIATDAEFTAAGLETPDDAEKRFLAETNPG